MIVSVINGGLLIGDGDGAGGTGVRGDQILRGEREAVRAGVGRLRRQRRYLHRTEIIDVQLPGGTLRAASRVQRVDCALEFSDGRERRQRIRCETQPVRIRTRSDIMSDVKTIGQDGNDLERRRRR